jgi:hypothetical protein
VIARDLVCCMRRVVSSKAKKSFQKIGSPLFGHRRHQRQSKVDFFCGQWWRVPDSRKDVPASAYATAGTRGQFVIVVPSHGLVIVHFSLKGFDYWDLVREVVRAVK